MFLRWASLQMSAHILQNLLLWWNLSAALRGCASFFVALKSIRNTRDAAAVLTPENRLQSSGCNPLSLVRGNF